MPADPRSASSIITKGALLAKELFLKKKETANDSEYLITLYLSFLGFLAKNPGRTLRLYLPVFTRVYLQMSTEVKYAQGGTKRRRESVIIRGAAGTDAISRRITRLAKSLKASNPIHCYVDALTYFNNISTTGGIYEVGNAIAQGDDYNQRFGSHADIQRLIVKGLIRGGATAISSAIRVTVFRGRFGLAFAPNTSGSYNPVVDSTSTRLYFDKFYVIGGATSTNGDGSVSLNMNIKLAHRQKFSGSGAGTNTAESVYLVIQSDFAAGGTAPTVSQGVIETYFKP